MTDMERIVTGYDGSPDSNAALRWAIWEAEARHTELAVCLAWAPHYLAAIGGREVYDLAKQRAEEILEDGLRYAKSSLGPGRVLPLLARSSPAEVLCEQSRTAELVVVGSRGHGGVPGLRLGSVAWQLASRGHGPVVVVRGEWIHPNENACPVVAGTDGSPASLAALTLAFHEAELRNVPLLAVCALADAPGILGGSRQLEEDFNDLMATQEKEHPDVRVIRRVQPGAPREALLAATEHAQLIAVGSRGRGRLDVMNLGSVAQAMLQYAPCPVAVTRPSASGLLFPQPKGVTTVPAASASSAAASSSRPIAAGRPVASANRQAASTFGPIEPAGSRMPRSCAAVARLIGRARAVPYPSMTAGTSVSSNSASAAVACANSAAVRSLSSTASTPCRPPSLPRVTGTPPPPVQMTTAPLAASSLIMSSSTIRTGSGEGTTRRHAAPSRRICQPRSPASRVAVAWS